MQDPLGSALGFTARGRHAAADLAISAEVSPRISDENDGFSTESGPACGSRSVGRAQVFGFGLRWRVAEHCPPSGLIRLRPDFRRQIAQLGTEPANAASGGT